MFAFARLAVFKCLRANRVAAYAVVVVLRGTRRRLIRRKMFFVDNFFGEVVTECVAVFECSACFAATGAVILVNCRSCACRSGYKVLFINRFFRKIVPESIGKIIVIVATALRAVIIRVPTLCARR